MGNMLSNLLSNFLMNSSSKISSIFSYSFLLSKGFNIKTIGEWILNFFAMIFYTIAKFILLFVDIMFSYIQRLCGLEMDFTSLSGMFSKESDIVLNLLLTSKDMVTPIIKNLIGLVIVVMIVFTIFALIKSQFDSIQNGNPTKIMDTLKKTIRAFILLIITPMISVSGIAFSNLLLQSLYKATNTSGGTTLGTQIFSSASTVASSYRVYAQNGVRIPIICDFTFEKEVLAYYEDVPANSKFTKYVKDSSNMIYATYMSFVEDDFMEFEYLNDILNKGTFIDDNKALYYGVYDIDYKSSADDFTPYRRIQAYKEEYYVMADVVDYAINTGNILYMKTIEQVLTSISQIQDTALRDEIFGNIINKFAITLYKGASTDANGKTELKEPVYDLTNNKPTDAELVQYYKSGNWKAICFDSKYLSSSGGGEPTTPMQIRYVHLKGAEDELNGAKFVMAGARNATADEIYYEPLSVGYCDKRDIDFESDYILGGQIVAAKGSFVDSVYPTAIKINNGEVHFYRDDIADVAAGAIDDVISANMKQKKNLFTMLKMFFKPDSADINVEIDFSSVNLTYDATSVTLAKIADGRMKAGYFLKYKNDLDSFTLASMFIPTKLNLLLLVAAPIILVKMCMIAFLGLIQRALELFLIIIMYPTAIVSIPIDDNGWETWWKSYITRLFQTYGLILGINFILMMFPIVSQMEYFTQDDIGTSKIIGRIGGLFFGKLTVRQVTNMFNMVVGILFQLVAFTLLETIPKTINSILGVEGELRSDAFANFMAIVKKVSAAAKMAGKALVLVLKAIPHSSSFANGADGVSKTEQSIKNMQKFKNFMKKLVPGSKLLESAQEKKSLKEKAKKEKEAKKELMEELKKAGKEKPGDKPGDDASPEEKKKYDEQKKEYEQHAQEIMDKFNAMNNAQEKHNDALADPKGTVMREQEEEMKKKVMGLDDEDDEDGEDGEDGSKSKFDDEDGEDGESGDGGNDNEFKTEKELKKEQKHAKKVLKKLKNQQKLGFGRTKELSPREQRAFDKYTAILDNAKEELDNRKDQKANKEQLQQEFNALTLKQDKSEEDNQRLQELDLIMNRGQKRKEHNKQVKVQTKAKKKADKQDAKIAAQKKADAELFGSARGNGIQNAVRRAKIEKRLKEINERNQEIEDAFKEAGIQDINNMTDDQKNGLTVKQQKMLREYEAFTQATDKKGNSLGMSYTEQIMQQQEEQIQALAKQKAREKMEKNKEVEGYRGINLVKHIRKGIHTGQAANSDVTAAEKEIIMKQMEALEEQRKTDPKAQREYLKLMEKKESLDAQLTVDRDWTEKNNAEYRKQNKSHMAEEKQRKKYEKRAVEILEATGKSVTVKNINQVVDNLMNKKQVKKNFKQQNREDLFSDDGTREVEGIGMKAINFVATAPRKGIIGLQRGAVRAKMGIAQSHYKRKLDEFYNYNPNNLVEQSNAEFEQEMREGNYTEKQKNIMREYRQISQNIARLEEIARKRKGE